MCFSKIEDEASWWGDCVKDQVEDLLRGNETLREKYGADVKEEGRGPLASGWCETV